LVVFTDFRKMNADELFQQIAAQEASLARTSVSEAQPNEAQVEESPITNTLFYGVYTGFVFAGTVLLLAMLKATCRFIAILI
jgi:hypothetical protein